MDKYIFKGLETFQLIEDMAYRSSSEDLEVYRLTGMAKELEEQGNYKEAIELYIKADEIYYPLHKEEMEELAREYGERDYLLHARLKNRIDSCNMSINRIKIKELEPKAKQLEETNPKEAIKIYHKLNEINPGLKKYNKRIEILERKQKWNLTIDYIIRKIDYLFKTNIKVNLFETYYLNTFIYPDLKLYLISKRA